MSEQVRKAVDAEAVIARINEAIDQGRFEQEPELRKLAVEAGLPIEFVRDGFARKRKEKVVPFRRIGALSPVIGALFGGGAAPKVEPEVEPEAEPEPEPEAEEEPKAAEVEEPPPGVLNPKAPLINARAFVALRCWDKGEDVSRLRYWTKEFWEWRDNHWQVLDLDTANSKVYKFLDQAEIEIRRGITARFEPDNIAVTKTIHALRGEVNLEPRYGMPGWFGKAPVENLRELVALQNGLLYVPTRKPIEHTPRFWHPNILEFRYEPKARAPRFEQFLREVFPGDEGAQQGLLEMIGLCLTDETKYQKAFMFVGPKRGGRGTIGRLLRGLVGEANYVGASLGDLSTDFGMEDWPERKVVVLSDEGLDGLSRAKLTAIAARLKKTTGEDEQGVNRKYRSYWRGVLYARIIVFSNELLRFQDDSGALSARFLTWRMTQSFAGREDHDLTGKLLAERAGIFNLALDALDRLRARGGLVQHPSGREMSESLDDMSSDIVPFARECCEVGPEYSAFLLALFDVWNDWCLRRGIKHGWGPAQFSEKLRAQFSNITSSRVRVDGRRVTELYGIGRKK